MESARIKAIIEECPKHSVWADIGCDHGMTSVGLLQAGKAERVFATDISAPSLAKAEELAAKTGYADRIECLLGDGLLVLEAGETDGIIISGMGAPLIADLLSRGKAVAEAAETLVLSANNYYDRLRKFLSENGWRIECERYVEEAGKYYIIMRAVKGREIFTERELLFGKKEAAKGGRKAHLEHELGVARRNIERIEAGGADASAMRELADMIREELENEA